MISSRIKQARLAAGFSLDECVARLKKNGFSITKPALSQYENGKRNPNVSVLQHLGTLFSVPATWFLGAEPGFSITWYAYRAQAALGRKKQKSIEAYAAHVAEKNAVVCSMFPDGLKSDFPARKKITVIEEADSVAEYIRKQWKLGSDALESVTNTIESHGAMVVNYNRQSTAKFDGLSALVSNKWPLLIVNNAVAVDRFRFDLAHELGHVLMDTSALKGEKGEEFAAHRFASSFLIPPPVLKAEIGGRRQRLSLTELVLLKEKYGISVAALLYALRTHGIITEQLFLMLQKKLSIRGWRKNEPDVFVGSEQPLRMRQLVTRAVTEDLMSVSEASILFPDFAAELQREFPVVETPLEKLRKLPEIELDAILRKSAEYAAELSKTDTSLFTDDGVDIEDYD